MVFQAGLGSQIRLELLTHLSQILGGKLEKFMPSIRRLSQVGIRNGWGPAQVVPLAGLGHQATHGLDKEIAVDQEQ